MEPLHLCFTLSLIIFSPSCCCRLVRRPRPGSQFQVLLLTSFQAHHCSSATVCRIKKPDLGWARGLRLLYLRKLSRRCGCREGVGHHGAEYIQVVVLACACASIVGGCSCRCVWDGRERERRENQLNQFHMCQTFAHVRKTHPHGTVYCSDEKGHESLTESRLDLDPVRN